MSGGREARCAGVPPRRFRLGEATARGVAFGSGAGSWMRGSGVDSGIVSATESVGLTAAAPPTVTTRYGAPPSGRGVGSTAGCSSRPSMAQPVDTSRAANAVTVIQTVRRMVLRCRMERQPPQRKVLALHFRAETRALSTEFNGQFRVRWTIFRHDPRSIPGRCRWPEQMPSH